MLEAGSGGGDGVLQLLAHHWPRACWWLCPLWGGLAGGYSCPFLSRVLHWVVWKFPAKLPLAEPLTWAVRAVCPVVLLSPWAQWPPSAAFSLPAGEPAGRTKLT